MVPGAGVEPAWAFSHLFLRQACLPVLPPRKRHVWRAGRESNSLDRGLQPRAWPFSHRPVTSSGIGARRGSRTHGLPLTGRALYHLSYPGIEWSGLRESNPPVRFGRPLPDRSAKPASIGAADRSRTRNLRFTGPLLYRLSYGGMIVIRTARDARSRTWNKPYRVSRGGGILPRSRHRVSAHPR